MRTISGPPSSTRTRTEYRLIAILIGGLIMCLTHTSYAELKPDSRAYLDGVLRDTFESIRWFEHPETGIPYDSNKKHSHTSTTNIGLYAASLAVGIEIGLIEKEVALEKIGKTLDSLEMIQRWHGFPVSWLNVQTLKTHNGHQFSTADHLGNLAASLIVVKILCPEFRERIEAYMEPMEWGYLYDDETGWLKGGYNVYRQEFCIDQPWGKWYYPYLGADTRLYSFLSVGSGQVPLKHWESLRRDTEEMFDYEYLILGWQGGGLFMQYLSGIFIREGDSEVGVSAKQFALAQMKNAKLMQLPAWGWSACVAPTGEYLGWGVLRDEVVTPHASALAAMYFPEEAAKNLKTLDEHGARPLLDVDGEKKAFGFVDSIDFDTGGVSDQILILDQAMTFLSLANVLHDGVVWKAFEKDAMVRASHEAISGGEPAVGEEETGRTSKPRRSRRRFRR